MKTIVCMYLNARGHLPQIQVNDRKNGTVWCCGRSILKDSQTTADDQQTTTTNYDG